MDLKKYKLLKSSKKNFENENKSEVLSPWPWYWGQRQWWDSSRITLSGPTNTNKPNIKNIN